MKLKYLLVETTDSSSSGKSTYATGLHFFMKGMTISTVVIEAFLSYYLSWNVLSRWPERGLDQYVFPLAVQITKGMKFTLPGSFILGAFICLAKWLYQLYHLSSGEIRCRHACRLQLPSYVCLEKVSSNFLKTNRVFAAIMKEVILQLTWRNKDNGHA